MIKVETKKGQIKYKLEVRDYINIFMIEVMINSFLILMLDMGQLFNNSFFEKSVVTLFSIGFFIFGKWFFCGNLYSRKEMKEFSELTPSDKRTLIFYYFLFCFIALSGILLVIYGFINIKQLFNNSVFQHIIMFLFSVSVASFSYYFWEKNKLKNFKVQKYL